MSTDDQTEDLKYARAMMQTLLSANTALMTTLTVMLDEAPGDADYEALGYEETRQGSTGQFDLDTWVDRRLYVMQQAGVYWCRETARHEFYSR